LSNQAIATVTSAASAADVQAFSAQNIQD